MIHIYHQTEIRKIESNETLNIKSVSLVTFCGDITNFEYPKEVYPSYENFPIICDVCSQGKSIKEFHIEKSFLFCANQ